MLLSVTQTIEKRCREWIGILRRESRCLWVSLYIYTVSYFSCASLQTWPRPTNQHSWGSEVAAHLAACSSALFTVAKTLTRAKFLDNAGQLGFQGVQVGAAV